MHTCNQKNWGFCALKNKIKNSLTINKDENKKIDIYIYIYIYIYLTLQHGLLIRLCWITCLSKSNFYLIKQ
jgi:hypothetical protein